MTARLGQTNDFFSPPTVSIKLARTPREAALRTCQARRAL